MKRYGIDCFAGIGGFSLALQRCGIEPKVQIEIDDFCQKILEKNFPKAKRFRDICAVTANDLRRYRPWIICGGFPCQDISSAGKGAGANEGERSGLWREMWRLIRTTRPRWLLIENVPALRTRGSDSVLAALEALGYTAWPLVVGALHVGAPHQRQRVWIVGYADGETRRACSVERAIMVGPVNGGPKPESPGVLVLEHTEGVRDGSWSLRSGREATITSLTDASAVPNTDSPGIREQSGRRGGAQGKEEAELAGDVQHAQIERLEGGRKGLPAFPAPRGCEQYDWECPRTVESRLGRTIDGLPGRLDKHRIKALGNAIVPQVAEAILLSIIELDKILYAE